MMRKRERLTPPSPTANTAPAPGGRGPRGRFAPGNRLARGNPLAQRVQLLRTALLEAVSVDDIIEIVERLKRDAKARNGNTAAKVLLDRVYGPPQPLDILERLEQLEARMEAKA
jgi:hypothetical protein